MYLLNDQIRNTDFRLRSLMNINILQLRVIQNGTARKNKEIYSVSYEFDHWIK